MKKSNLKNKLFYLLLVIFTFTEGNSQELLFLKNFNNSTLRYTTYRTSLFQSNIEDQSKPDIYIKIDLSKENRDLYSTLTKEQILNALNDEMTDFAMNLFLYEKYKKSAVKFVVVKTRSEWLSSYKDEDVKYWKHILKD